MKQHLSHYRIGDLIGAGAMGEVYRATDSRLGRDVALKVLPSEMAADANRLARFKREAQTVAALSHPNIVTIHSVEEDDGVHFLTMELIAGQSLDQLLPSEGFPLERFNELSLAIVDAVASAHARGIVHRDLKPSNIMVTDEGGHVKVLDFGLAKLTESEGAAEGDDQPTVTQTHVGTLVGTPSYMSPEQARTETVDTRSDVFSLGIILFEMATGKRPFEGASTVELLSAILKDAPPRLADLRPGMPNHLEAIIGRCLEKNAERRYANARELHAALRSPQQVLVSSPGISPPTNDETLRIAVLPFSDMSATRDQEYFCEGMAEEIMNALVRIEGIRVAPRMSAFRARKESEDLEDIGRMLSVGYILEGSVRVAGNRMRVSAQLIDLSGGFQLWSEQYNRESGDVFEIQDEITAGLVDAVRSRLAPDAPAEATPSRGADRPTATIADTSPRAENLEAYKLYLKGRHNRLTLNNQGEAIRCFQQAVELDPSHGKAWVGLAEATYLSAMYGVYTADIARAKVMRAVETSTRLQGKSADTLQVQGMLAFSARDWTGARTVLRRALALEPDHVQARCWLALVDIFEGDTEKGLRHMSKAERTDPLSAYPLAMSSMGYNEAGHREEALELCERALQFQPDNTLANWLGTAALIGVGRPEDAVGMAERGVDQTNRNAFYVGCLGWALAEAGDTDRARDLLVEIQATFEPGSTIVSEAFLRASLGQIDDAFAVMDRARDEMQTLVLLTGMSWFDRLRDDPRFDGFLSSVGLA